MPVASLQDGLGRQQGVRGAELWLLDHKGEAWMRRQRDFTTSAWWPTTTVVERGLSAAAAAEDVLDHRQRRPRGAAPSAAPTSCACPCRPRGRRCGRRRERRASRTDLIIVYRVVRERTGRRRSARVAAGASERRPERVVAAQRLEVRVAPGEGAVLGVECDGALEVCDGFGVFAALRVRDREHVERVVVVGIFVADEPQVRDRLIVAAAVDGERRRVQAFVDAFGARLRVGVAWRWQMFR